MLVTEAIQLMRVCISQAEPANDAGRKDQAIEFLKITAKKIISEFPDAEPNTDQRRRWL